MLNEKHRHGIFLFALTALVIAAVLGLPSLAAALDTRTTTSVQQNMIYPTDCVEGPVNTLTMNYPHGPPGNNESCEICLSMGYMDPTEPSGIRIVGNVCGLSTDRIMEMYAVQQRTIYCGVILPSPDQINVGKGYSPPLVAESFMQPPCVGG